MSAVAVVIAAVLLLSSHDALASDPCTITSLTPMPPAAMHACFDTLEFNASVAKTTLDSLSAGLELYAFLDIASKPPASALAVEPVDLLASIDSLSSQKFEHDFEFHAELATLFRGLHDAHTRYIVPGSYRSFTLVQPIILVSFMEDEKTTVVETLPWPSATFPDLIAAYVEQTSGVDIHELGNATVEEINGMNAVEYLTAFAEKHVGFAKDLNTRYNQLFAQGNPTPGEPRAMRRSAFTVRTGDESPMPDRDEEGVEYVLRLASGEMRAVTLPWVAFSNVDISDTAQFRKMSEPSSSKTAPKRASHLHQDDMLSDVKSFAAHDAIAGVFASAVADHERLHSKKKTPATALSACEGSSSCFVPLLDSYLTPNVHFYRREGDDKTVIMYLDTFGPNNSTLFMIDVANGLDKAAELGLTNLIIDLTNNGGGDICLGVRLLQYLFDQKGTDGPTDLPQSKLAVTMAKNGVALDSAVDGPWSPHFYSDMKNNSFSDASWMLPGVEHTRGGRKRSYSQHVELSELACSYDPRIPRQRVSVDQVLIVTRGFCGSTCALFSGHANQLSHVRTIAVGSLAGDQQFLSFPGLQVMGTPSLLDLVDAYLPNDPDLRPAHVPTSAIYRMCIREIYPTTEDTTPTEYAFQAATHSLKNTKQTALLPELTWFDAIKLF